MSINVPDANYSERAIRAFKEAGTWSSRIYESTHDLPMQPLFKEIALLTNELEVANKKIAKLEAKQPKTT